MANWRSESIAQVNRGVLAMDDANQRGSAIQPDTWRAKFRQTRRDVAAAAGANEQAAYRGAAGSKQ